MLIEDQHPLNKSIEVGLIGRPNVGKSSLINELVGVDLSIVSPLPQTTRNRFSAMANIDHTEIILTDTPGINYSNQEFIKRMMGQTKRALEHAELILFLIDPSQDLLEQWDIIKDFLPSSLKSGKNAFLWPIITKSDLLPEESRQSKMWDSLFEAIKSFFPQSIPAIFVSAKTQENIHLLTSGIEKLAKPARHLYPDGDLSNKNERFFVSEYIREQAFHLLKEELPYETAVLIDNFQENFKSKEKNPNLVAKIEATILVNRESQRPIVIGQQGKMIRDICAQAKIKIEKLLQGKVDLKLHVKSSPKWTSNNYILEELGLPRVENSNRVWRKHA